MLVWKKRNLMDYILTKVSQLEKHKKFSEAIALLELCLSGAFGIGDDQSPSCICQLLRVPRDGDALLYSAADRVAHNGQPFKDKPEGASGATKEFYDRLVKLRVTQARAAQPKRSMWGSLFQNSDSATPNNASSNASSSSSSSTATSNGPLLTASGLVDDG